VFKAGTAVSFLYEVWLDPTSTGVVTFGDSTTGVVTDDNGTPAESADDFQPAYVSGDDGDGVLELGEVWRYAADNVRTAVAGERYTNYSSIPSGDVHRASNVAGPAEGTSSPRRDPAGYIVPSLQTSVAAAIDGGQIISPAGGTLVDTVSYANLVPGDTVNIAGEVQHRESDGSVTATGITAIATVTPTSATGSAEVTFTVPVGVQPGSYVVFESLSFAGIVVAEHVDPDDEAQIFTVVRPSLATTASNLDDGSKFLSDKGGTVVDEVCFTDLHGTTSATVDGELQRRAIDGTVQPTGITGTVTFTVLSADDCVNVQFSVPAGSDPGTFVVFEDLVVAGTVVASHRDPDDADQTFVKRSPIQITTEACHSQLTTPKGAPSGLTCDRITVTGDPGDVVSGTSTAYPWVADARDCSRPGAVASWTITVGPNGLGTVETEMVAVPIGASWEWIESATAADGREFSRNCFTSPKDARESFVMRRGGGGGNEIPQTGTDAGLVLQIAIALIAFGLVTVFAGRRRRVVLRG
jgi:hypothetical protein